MYIVQVASECAPVAKVGGLADVVFGLSRELQLRGHRVDVILPKYDTLAHDQIWDLRPIYHDLWVPWYEAAVHCTVYEGQVHGLRCLFIEPHSADNFFGRGAAYGAFDDGMRFAFFSRAALEYVYKASLMPDVLHCHDWQTGWLPVLLFEMYQALGMTAQRVCYTIHNFMHQGVIGPEVLRATGLGRPEHFYSPERLRDDGNPALLNPVRGGIVYSNFVTTVSPRHAQEVRNGQGHGLEHILGVHAGKFGGVLNGIDYDAWNPQQDPLIPDHYSVDYVDPKYGDKGALRQRLMLRDAYKPIVAYVGRLDGQKGVHLIRHAIFRARETNAQFVLLGSAPDPAINKQFWQLKRELDRDEDIHLELGFDEALAHLIYAGADIMIVPSNFEPCGLTQMIAMRYGTVPVVRSVGGLADTVFDREHGDVPAEWRNGFVFHDANEASIQAALDRAIGLWHHDPRAFRNLLQQGMRHDNSWNHPGQHYQNIYEYIRA